MSAPGAPLRAYSMGPPLRAHALRLHLNEYRYAHPPGVVAAAAAADEAALTNYSFGPDAELAADLARYVGAPAADNVLITPGSDEALRAIIDTSTLRGHSEVVMGVPGYTHFEHYAKLKGLGVVPYAIGLETSPADHEASLRYYGDRFAAGCLVYICNPNNPTGDLWAGATVAALAAEYPRSLFLVDEAYVEFASVGAPGAAALADAAALNVRSLVPVALAAANVVVTRTLSKAFGLAGARVGYAVASAPLVAELRIAVSPKAFGSAASAVARAALRHLGHYRGAASAARAEAAAVVAALTAAGWWALDTPGNFYLVYVGDAAATAAALADRHGIQVRDRGDLPGLAGFVRITAGTAADSAAVVAAFATMTPPAGVAPQKLYTSKGHVARCKTLMKQATQVLREAGVEFFAQGGTMLGMVRHGGMIPTDDDGDLAYCRADGGHDPLRGGGRAFAAAGLTLQRNRTDAYWQVGTNAPGEPISPVHVDLFSYSLCEGRYVLDDARFRAEDPGCPQAGCNTSYAPDELFPLRGGCAYYDLAIPVPAESERALRRALGDDFMHIMRARPAGGGPAVALPLSDYSPA